MLACYYPQGIQHGLDQSQPRGLRGLSVFSTDNYNIWEVHVRPRRGARRGFATTERARCVCKKRTTMNWALWSVFNADTQEPLVSLRTPSDHLSMACVHLPNVLTI